MDSISGKMNNWNKNHRRTKSSRRVKVTVFSSRSHFRLDWRAPSLASQHYNTFPCREQKESKLTRRERPGTIDHLIDLPQQQTSPGRPQIYISQKSAINLAPTFEGPLESHFIKVESAQETRSNLTWNQIETLEWIIPSNNKTSKAHKLSDQDLVVNLR